MKKCFSIAFLETNRCESTNIGPVDTDLIKKEIYPTTKKKDIIDILLIIDGHPLIDL